MRALRLLVTTVTAVAMVSGCSIVNEFKDGVSDPMTPEEAKAQVIAAARWCGQDVAAQGCRRDLPV